MTTAPDPKTRIRAWWTEQLATGQPLDLDVMSPPNEGANTVTLFNSQNPRIAAAHAHVVETLAGIPDEYGAVFVVDEYQQELRNAVAVGTHRIRRNAATLNRIGGKDRTPGNLVDLAERGAS